MSSDISGRWSHRSICAGVYAALYYWMKKDITDAENIFDIVAGALRVPLTLQLLLAM